MPIFRIPQWIADLIAYEFNAEEMEVIAANWFTYWQGSMTNASKEDFLNAAHAILWMTGYHPKKVYPKVLTVC
jgi:hypothetical protein